jgi:hypothetical protein
MPDADMTWERRMDEPAEAIALGAGWIRRLKAQAHRSLCDFPLSIGLGTALTVGMVLTIPLAPAGIAAFTCVMVTMLGVLSWAARPGRRSTFPFGPLIGLSAALLLLEAPVLLMLAQGGGPLAGTLMLIAVAVIGSVAPPLGVWAFLLAAPACVACAVGLGACFAPHLIGARGSALSQALHRSLLAWGRNPVAFLVFLGLGVALVALRIVAMWIAALVLFPVPAAALVLGHMIWAAAALCYAAALVGFGRRVFDASASTALDECPESEIR